MSNGNGGPVEETVLSEDRKKLERLFRPAILHDFPPCENVAVGGYAMNAGKDGSLLKNLPNRVDNEIRS